MWSCFLDLYRGRVCVKIDAEGSQVCAHKTTAEAISHHQKRREARLMRGVRRPPESLADYDVHIWPQQAQRHKQVCACLYICIYIYLCISTCIGILLVRFCRSSKTGILDIRARRILVFLWFYQLSGHGAETSSEPLRKQTDSSSSSTCLKGSKCSK